MKKRIFTGITSLLIAISTLSSFSINTYADNNLYKEIIETNEQIDIYIGDPELEAYVQEKQRIAEQLYNATISGNTELATQLQTDFSKLEKDKLNQIHNKNQVNSNENTVLSYPPPPASYTIPNLYHYSQINRYYCGPATAYMILKALGVNTSQSILAGSNYLKTDIYGETPWFLTNGESSSQFVMATTLNSMQSKKYYIPSPLGQAGANPLSTTKVKSYVMSATSQGNGIAFCGTSNAIGQSHIPNYPAENIDHWLACRGYYGNGNYIWILDPAYGANGVSYAYDITGSYDITAETCQAFIAPRGMIW